MPEESSASYEIVHVLWLDIVAYSLQPIDRQTELLTLLQKIVRESAEYQRAQERNEIISLPTGDGVGLVFLRDPLSPVKCSLEIAASLRNYPQLAVRMGIHSGPVQRHSDIREAANVVGGGINTAQRVMDCGDAGHILLSRNVVDVLEQFSDWRECLHDLGIHEVKHGLKLHLYNLVKAPTGNPAMPQRLIAGAGAALKAEAKLAAAEESPRRKELSHRGILFAAVFVLTCVVAVSIETWLDRGIESGETSVAAHAAFSFSGLYQRVVAAPRNPIPRYTAVVEIDAERDPGSISLHDVCAQRRMMAVLVRRIAGGLPKLIAIDKFFGTRTCPGNTNADLISAVAEVSAKVPVIIGRRILDGEHLGYLDPTLFPAVPGLQEAILNIDPDSRRLPLAWEAYATKESIKNNGDFAWRETMAVKAAKDYEGPEFLARHPRLNGLLKPPPQRPYISFFGLEQFQQFRFLAGYVLCGREVKPGEDATACVASPEALAHLSGKIVLIGEVSKEEDQWSSVIGRIPGVYLQANFIEALLDDRYYEGFSALNYILGFLFLASMELILAVFHSWPKKLGAIGVLVLATGIVLYVVITDFHRYANPLPFIALALLIRALVASLPYFRVGQASGLPR